MEEVIGTCLFLFTRIACAFKIIAFVFNRKKVVVLMNILESKEFTPINAEQRKLLRRMMNEVKFMSIIFIATGVLAVIFKAISPEIDSKTRGQRKLPLNHWEPFNTKQTPYFQIAYIYHIIIYLSAATNNIAMDTFISGMMAHGIVQVEMLKNSLETIVERTLNEITISKGLRSVSKTYFNLSNSEKRYFKQKLDNNLRQCISHHKQILRYTKEVESLFSLGIFIQIAASVIVLCMTTFQMSILPPSSLQFQSISLYLSCILTEIFLFCWYGEGLTVSSSEICNSLYKSTWYNIQIGRSYAKNMLIFMMKALKPINFKPGSFFVLSVQMFISILRSSYTFYAVLHQVQNNE